MKHVWMLNHYAVAPGGAGGTRHYSLAKNLPAFGWSVCIIASSVELNTGRQRLSRGEHTRLEDIAGVPFLWIRTPAYDGNGGGRMLNMLAYSVRVLLPAATRGLTKPDVIIGSSVHPFAAVAGALLAKRFRVPFVFEVRDLWPQTLIDLGLITSQSTTARIMRLIERWLYRRADRIVTLLPRAVDYIAPFGINKKKVVWIPNGVELVDFPDPGPPSSSDGPFKLMYFGAHGQANALENVLQAMKLLQDDIGVAGVHLRMIGDGPAKPSLQTLAQQLELQNVSFEPPVPKSEVTRLAAQADAFVLSVLDRPNLYRYGISMNKLYDYLAARRPVIMASAAVNDPIRDACAGFSIFPENPKALAGAVKDLMAMSSDVREGMGVAGRRYVEQHNDFKVLAKSLAEVLDECVEGHGAKKYEFH